MNIVLLYDKLEVGGTEKLIVLIANLLHGHEHKVSVIIFTAPKQLDHLISKGIDIIYLHRKSRFSLNPLRLLSKLCKSADIIHVHTYYNYRYFFLAKKLFGEGKGKVVMQEHSNMANISLFDKFLFKSLDAFVAVSDKQVDLLKKRKTISLKKVFLVPNIISVSNKIGKRDEVHNRIIMVGNIRREKNYELALSIIKHFKGRITLDIYGNINDQDYYGELIDAVKRENIKEQVNIISGEADVSKFFHQYDVALHTASKETGPLVLMEYMSAGLPFFCSTAGQSSIIVFGCFPQFVIPSYEKNAWINAIEKFYDQSQDSRNNLTEAIRQKADEIINTEDYYRSFINIYDKVLA
ncbi:MAG TPA: glycosyltransferase family 4 protein [Segetibacter sp.]